MDIARPELKQRKRRRQIFIGCGVALLLSVTVAGLSLRHRFRELPAAAR